MTFCWKSGENGRKPLTLAYLQSTQIGVWISDFNCNLVVYISGPRSQEPARFPENHWAIAVLFPEGDLNAFTAVRDKQHPVPPTWRSHIKFSYNEVGFLIQGTVIE